MLTVGQEIDSYYGNGSFIKTMTITRMNEKSVWFDGHWRESRNTVQTKIQAGLYKVKG